MRLAKSALLRIGASAFSIGPTTGAVLMFAVIEFFQALKAEPKQN